MTHSAVHSLFSDKQECNSAANNPAQGSCSLAIAAAFGDLLISSACFSEKIYFCLILHMCEYLAYAIYYTNTMLPNII